MPAEHDVPFRVQQLGELDFHRRGIGERHCRQMLVELRREPHAELLHDSRRLSSCLVPPEPFVERQSRHPHVVADSPRAVLISKLDDVDAVVEGAFLRGLLLFPEHAFRTRLKPEARILKPEA